MYRHRIYFKFGLKKTLCQFLMGRMGSRPIRPVKVSVTIDTMLNLYWAEFKIKLVSVRVNKAKFQTCVISLCFIRKHLHRSCSVELRKLNATNYYL